MPATCMGHTMLSIVEEVHIVFVNTCIFPGFWICQKFASLNIFNAGIKLKLIDLSLYQFGRL